jgi:hypothetical protein
VVQNNKGRRSAIDQRTTRHPGYEVSQGKRKRVEEIFGWLKTVGLLRKTRHRGLRLVGGSSSSQPPTTWSASEIWPRFRERLRPNAISRLGKRTEVANEPLKGSTLERNSLIIDKQNFSMKTEPVLTAGFSAAC